MASFIDQLAQICREHFLVEKILISPSLAVGHQIGDRLAQNGTPWVNLRVETVRTLVDAVIGFEVAAEGVTVLSRAQSLALVERACSESLGAGGYFSGLAGQRGLVEAFQQTLDDLRHASVALDSINGEAFEVPQKRGDLQRVLERYEALLTEEKYIDRAGMLLRAIGKLRRENVTWPERIWIDIRDDEATAAESELIERLTGGNVLRLAVAAADHASALCAGERQVELFAAVGEENEVREVFRHALRRKDSFGGTAPPGEPAPHWDSIEVVYTQRETYLPLIYELAAQYEVPCTFAEGVPAAYTRPVQAVLGFLRWLADDYAAIELQRIVGGSAVELGDEGLTPLVFVRSIRRAAIGWGRERYLRRLDELIASYEEDDSRREDASRTRAFVERLLAIVPQLGETVDVSELARATMFFAQKFTRTTSELDGMARLGLVGMLEEIAALASSPVSIAEACARLTTAVTAVHVGASNPRPGLLHVAGLTNGAWSGRPETFVLGLDDAKYPGKGLQDPILLDTERRGINVGIAPRQLALLGDRPRQNIDALWRVIGTAAGRITLSFSSRDLLQERDSFPASPLLEIFRLLREEPAATYADLFDSLRQSTSRFISDTPLEATEWWAARAASASREVRTQLGAVVGQVYPWVESGRAAEEARGGSDFTRYDGRLSVDSALIDPRRSGRVMSSSQIETLAKCPFSWFLKYLLQVKPVDELVRDPLRWLEAYQLGNLLHTVFQHFMEELATRGETPRLDHEPLLDEIAGRELEEWRANVPPPNEAAFERSAREVREACSVFLTSEVEYCGRAAPRYFEAAFGFEGENGSISSPDPVEIPLGEGLTLRVRGRIDRVDAVGEAQYEIWDYKTGSPYLYRKSGRFYAGSIVQHAIYAAAFEELLRRAGQQGKVVTSGYYFTSPKGEGERLPKHTTRDELQEVLNLLFDMVAAGTFPSGEKDRCTFCDYPEICGGEIATSRMKAKLENSTNADRGLDAWRRLQDVD